MQSSQLNQQQIDDVCRSLKLADVGALPESSAQMPDPNRPGAMFAIPIWIRLAAPTAKMIAGFFGITITIPTLADVIARVQDSNLPGWAKSAALSALLYLQDHPEVLPVFV